MIFLFSFQLFENDEDLENMSKIKQVRMGSSALLARSPARIGSWTCRPASVGARPVPHSPSAAALPLQSWPCGALKLGIVIRQK